MVFPKCMTCRVLTTLFILLISASLYFKKENRKYVNDFVNGIVKNIEKNVKENLVVNGPTQEIINRCERMDSKTSGQCNQFLQDKCTYKNCKAGIEVLPFNMNNKEDSISYAKSCLDLCNTRCKTLEFCTKSAANPDPYNIFKNADSVSENL